MATTIIITTTIPRNCRNFVLNDDLSLDYDMGFKNNNKNNNNNYNNKTINNNNNSNKTVKQQQ